MFESLFENCICMKNWTFLYLYRKYLFSSPHMREKRCLSNFWGQRSCLSPPLCRWKRTAPRRAAPRRMREDERWCCSVTAALTPSPSNGKHQPPPGPMGALGERRESSPVAVNALFQEAAEQRASHPGGAARRPPLCTTSGRAGASLNRCEDGRCRARERRTFTGIYWTAAGRNYLKVRGFKGHLAVVVSHVRQQLLLPKLGSSVYHYSTFQTLRQRC